MKEGIQFVLGGIDNYFIFVDFCFLGLIGKVVEYVFDEIGIILNKNVILYDLEKFFVISGICFGIVVVISCGFDGDVLDEVGVIIGFVLKNYEDEGKLEEVRQCVVVLIGKFFLYKELDY